MVAIWSRQLSSSCWSLSSRCCCEVFGGSETDDTVGEKETFRGAETDVGVDVEGLQRGAEEAV